MIIALSQRVVQETSYQESRDALSHDWQTYIERIGGVPIAVPNGLKDVSRFLKAISPDYIILTGGGTARGYADNNEHDLILRNQTEEIMINYAIHHRVPLLGVCRGMQMIHIYFGGKLLKIGDRSNHISTMHTIRISKTLGSNIIKGSSWKVNSFHQWGIKDDQLPSQLEAFAVCELDKSIEGLLHPVHPIIGVIWHPEREGSDELLNNNLIQYFLKLKEGAV